MATIEYQREGTTCITPKGRAMRTAATRNPWLSEAVLMADAQNIHVEFTVKELFSRIERQLGDIDSKITGKADHIALVDLQKRVVSLEQDRAYDQGMNKATWAIVGLLIAIAGLLIPVVMQSVAGGLT